MRIFLRKSFPLTKEFDNAVLETFMTNDFLDLEIKVLLYQRLAPLTIRKQFQGMNLTLKVFVSHHSYTMYFRITSTFAGSLPTVLSFYRGRHELATDS